MVKILEPSNHKQVLTLNKYPISRSNNSIITLGAYSKIIMVANSELKW